MQFTNLENVLWAGGLLSNCALLAVLLLKKVAAEFPVFAAYIAFQVVETFALFGVANRGSNHAYFITYWAFGAVDYAVQIAIIFELARDVLRPTGSWIQDARRSFLSWSAVGTLAAMAMAFAIHPPGRTGLELWSIRSSIFTSFLTCELFLAMSMAANRLGLPWRSPVMALGQGLTFWAGVALIADIAHYATGWQSNMRMFDTLRSFAYDATVIYWAISFTLPEQRREPLSAEMQQYLTTLHARVKHDLRAIKPENKPRP